VSTRQERRTQRLARQRARRARLYPELALFPIDEYQRAVKSAQSLPLRQPLLWIALALIVAAVVVVGPTLRRELRGLGMPDVVAEILVVVGTGAITGVSLLAIVRTPVRRALRRRLVELGTAICVNCGYDLRGQTQPRCPECGKAFDPALLTPADRADPDAAPRHDTD
jgi:hypothetical protein